jgi:hypothetical protein
MLRLPSQSQSQSQGPGQGQDLARPLTPLRRQNMHRWQLSLLLIFVVGLVACRPVDPAMDAESPEFGDRPELGGSAPNAAVGG